MSCAAGAGAVPCWPVGRGGDAADDVDADCVPDCWTSMCPPQCPQAKMFVVAGGMFTCCWQCGHCTTTGCCRGWGVLKPAAMLVAALNAVRIVPLVNMGSVGGAGLLWPDESVATGMAQFDAAGRAHADTRNCPPPCAAGRDRSSRLIPAKPGRHPRPPGSAGRAAQHPVANAGRTGRYSRWVRA